MVRIVEKPPKGSAESNWNNAGIFVFSPAVFRAIRSVPLSPRGELELTAAIQWLCDQFGDVMVYRLRGLWSDVGNPAKVLELNQQILADLSLGVPVARATTPPAGAQIDATSAVDEGAELETCRVEAFSCVAAGARVGAGAVLRRSAVFPGGVVERECELEYAIVVPGARVAAGERVHGTAEAPAVVL
jgi:NDP-sugar pyrophosphorylase family protein